MAYEFLVFYVGDFSYEGHKESANEVTRRFSLRLMNQSQPIDQD